MLRDSIRHRHAINPLHAILLASTLPLFLGAVLSNWAYAESYQIQWTNFASWLTAGGLVFAGLALVWAAINLFRSRGRHRRLIHAALVLAMFVAGFLTSLLLAKDAWAAMPGGFILSIITFALAVAANWSAYATQGRGEPA